MKKEIKYKRFHMRMNEDLYGWYADEANKLDVPISAFMIMAMSEYRKQQTTLASMPEVMKMIEMIEMIKEEPLFKKALENINMSDKGHVPAFLDTRK